MALEEEAALSVHQSIIFENLRAQGQDVSEAMASINSKMCAPETNTWLQCVWLSGSMCIPALELDSILDGRIPVRCAFGAAPLMYDDWCRTRNSISRIQQRPNVSAAAGNQQSCCHSNCRKRHPHIQSADNLAAHHRT